MSHRKTKAAWLALLLTVVCPPALGQQDDALTSLDRLLGDTTTLAADVTQMIVESDGGVLEESLIRMRLKRPGGFYWETLEPFPELVVTNGERLWNYQPDLEQVVVEPWDNSRSQLAAQLLNGETDSLGSDYQVERISAEDDPFVEFRLTPLASDSVYDRITLTFRGAELDMIHLRQKNGEQTVWQFDNVERNQTLAEGLFEFEPPAGIEVIDNDYLRQ